MNDLLKRLLDMEDATISMVASFSGGKDSTAMVLRLVEEDWPMDKIIFFDTGWEFPQIYDNIYKVEEYTGRKITFKYPKRSFLDWMLIHPVIISKGLGKGKLLKYGVGWPSHSRRWCTREKVATLEEGGKDSIYYIGFAYDEQPRTEGIKLSKKLDKLRFPLIQWHMTENDCLTYCKKRGFNFGGVYGHFDRVSCFCCPLQGNKELRRLRKYYPELWAKMLLWESQMDKDYRVFQKKTKLTLSQLDQMFAKE